MVVFCTTYALILPAITTKTDIFCGLEEHTHTKECYRQVSVSEPLLICTSQTLGVHSHTEDCWAIDGSLSCGQAGYVAHSHNELCYDGEGTLRCTLEERSTHIHSAQCYENISAGTSEAEHVHSEACYATVRGELSCTIEENDEHSHNDDCYCWAQTVVCGMEESSQGNVIEDVFQTPQTHKLICGEVEAATHVHGEACFCEAQQALTCTMEENEAHVHTELCYGVWELTCERKEHTHDVSCYSDPQADLESEEDWEATFADVKMTGKWQEDVLAIAQTQLGYAESQKNYIITDSGSRKGYSRYGAWYGDMYGDWCAMFASFCLRYGGAEDFPIHSNCGRWIEALAAEGVDLYRDADENYEPQPGDVVFYDWDGDGTSEHVGLVVEIIPEVKAEKEEDCRPAQLKVIEGNSSNCVQYVTYDLHSEQILGYGDLNEAYIRYRAEHPFDKVYEDDSVTVRLSHPVTADIPEEAELVVREFPADSEEYEQKRGQAETLLMENTTALTEPTIMELKLLDISLQVDGKRIDPTEAVEVVIEYKTSAEWTQPLRGALVSYSEEGAQKPTVQNTTVDTQGNVRSAFKTESLSQYAVVLTRTPASSYMKQTDVEEDDLDILLARPYALIDKGLS